ncbi:MAG TPA: hypothetical protein VGV86_08265 [Acidimicrobiales bacterium]|nr:hypothetical protein [Acidimicrobiales bacterium]
MPPGTAGRREVESETKIPEAAKPRAADAAKELVTPVFVLYYGPEADDAPGDAITFSCEIEARAALARLRSSPLSMSQWAELVRTGPATPAILAWFGRPSPRFTAHKLESWSVGRRRVQRSSGPGEGSPGQAGPMTPE